MLVKYNYNEKIKKYLGILKKKILIIILEIRDSDGLQFKKISSELNTAQCDKISSNYIWLNIANSFVDDCKLNDQNSKQ